MQNKPLQPQQSLPVLATFFNPALTTFFLTSVLHLLYMKTVHDENHTMQYSGLQQPRSCHCEAIYSSSPIYAASHHTETHLTVILKIIHSRLSFSTKPICARGTARPIRIPGSAWVSRVWCDRAEPNSLLETGIASQICKIPNSLGLHLANRDQLWTSELILPLMSPFKNLAQTRLANISTKVE